MSDTAKNGVLPEGLVLPGPNVIGATGGSGTRVVARIARTAGVYTGVKLNPYEDAVELGFYSDRWIDGYVRAGGDLAQEERAEMESDLRRVLADHLSTVPRDAISWGGRSRGASTSCASGTRRCRAFSSSTSCATGVTWRSRRTRIS